MTDVDAVARECAKKLEPHGVHSWVEFATSIIATALRERDAEWQAKLDEAEAQAAAMRERLELGGKVAAAIGLEPANHVVQRLSDWWYKGTLQLLYKDGIPIRTAGRTLLAEVERLRGGV